MSNLLLLQLLNWLVKPLWIFWIDRSAQVKLGDVWYGKYYVVFSFALLFNILLDFGLNNFLTSAISRDGNLHRFRKVFQLRMWLALGFVLIVAVFGILQQFDKDILIFIIGNQVLAGFVLLMRSVLQGRHLFRADSVISVTDRLTAIVLCAAVIYTPSFSGKTGILYFLGAQTLGYVIALSLSAFMAFKGQSSSSENAGDENFSSLFKQAGWFAVLAFAMSVFTRIDALMIRNFSPGTGADAGYAEAGIYAQSFRLLDAALIFSSLISTLLLPTLSKMIAARESTHDLLWLNIRIIWFVAVPVMLYAAFFSYDILDILYGKSYSNFEEHQYSAMIFFPVMSCFAFMGTVHVFGTWLTAAHRVKYLSISAFFCIVINVVLNYIFIPRFGALAAAYNCLITQGIFAAICLAGTCLLKGFKLEWKPLLRMGLWLLLSAVSFYISSYFYEGFKAMFLAGILFLFATLFSGLFHPEIRKIRVKKQNN